MTRRNFYQGQSVAPEHLNALQDYADEGNANLISSLLGYGIVDGFVVSTVSGHIVSITSGLAFNMAGERLVLAEGQTVNLSQYAPSIGEKTIKLGIAIDYTQSDPMQDSFGETVNTKWTPTVQFITGETLESGVFELAEITINSSGVTTLKNTGVSFTTLQKLLQNTSSMEIGSNDNGTYIKFENGLLICFSVISISLAVGDTNGNVTWVFPHSMRDNTYGYTVGFNNVYTQAAVTIGYYSKTSDLMIIRATKSTSSVSVTIPCSPIVIGFWK